MATPRCPQCLQAMQALQVREVELDRCARCGGLWFDAGELEQLTGRSAKVEPVGDLTNSLCARCDIPLGVVALGPVQGETCPGCHGLFLERGVLHLYAPDAPGLGAKAPPPAPASRPAAPPPVAPPPQSKPPRKRAQAATGFDCAVCGQRKPFTEGNAHPRGLVCRACVIPVQIERNNGRSSWGLGSSWDSDGDVSDWADAIGAVISVVARFL